MSHHAAGVKAALAPAAVLASNVIAWASDMTAGSVMSSLTVLGVGGAALVVHVRKQLAESRHREWADDQRVKLEMERERARVKAEIDHEQLVQELKTRADRENADRDSLTALVEQLKRSQDEAAARVEDANKKLHQIRNEAQADSLRRREEIDQLTRQLELAYTELHEVREQNRKLTAEVQSFRDENRQLLSRLAAVQGQVAANTASIDVLTERAATPDPDATPTPGGAP